MPVTSLTDTLTALEAVNRLQPDADARRIVEALAQTNEILLDAPVRPANGKTQNTTITRTALPQAEHRIYNQGVGTSASQTKTSHDKMTSIAQYSYVDKKLIDDQGDLKQQFIMSEATAFINGMGQQQAEDIVYANSAVEPENMDGFASRRGKIGGNLCIDMKGTRAGHLTSIYVVKWGMGTAHLIYPQGSTGVGVKREDLGVRPWEVSPGKKMQSYVNYFEANYGLTLRDQKALIRLCNIDLEKTTGDEIIKTILKSYHYLPAGEGTIAIYGSAGVMSLMDIATLDKNNVVYTAADPYGNQINHIRNGRLRQVDAILETEDQVK